jgi:hypothetical protein
VDAGKTLLLDAQRLRKTLPFFPDHAGSMRFIQNKMRVVLTAQAQHRFQRRHIAVHRKYRFSDHKDPGAAGRGQPPLQIVTVIMRKRMRLRERQPDPIPDRGMAEMIVQDRIAALRHTTEDAEVSIIPGIEQQSRSRLMKIRKQPLRLFDEPLIPRE